MGYYLESKAADAEITHFGWANVLKLAERFGWDRSGYRAREPECDEYCDTHEVCEDAVDQAAADGGDRSDFFIPAGSAKSFADALEMALYCLKARHTSLQEAVAAHSRISHLMWTPDPSYESVSTEDLMDAFGHQRQLLEEIIAVARGGEVSIW